MLDDMRLWGQETGRGQGTVGSLSCNTGLKETGHIMPRLYWSYFRALKYTKNKNIYILGETFRKL